MIQVAKEKFNQMCDEEIKLQDSKSKNATIVNGHLHRLANVEKSKKVQRIYFPRSPSKK